MRRLSFLAAVLAIAVAGPSPSHRPSRAPARPAPAAYDVLAALPVAFEPAGDAGFVSRGPGFSVALSPAEAVVALRDATFRLRPAGPTVNQSPALVPGEPLTGTVTRLTGDDPAGWTAGVSTFGRVEVRQVWPGVDMVWHGDQRRLEHDMIVAPGVDPSVVAVDVDGARSLTVDPQGDLVIDLGATTARLARPVVYQDVAGARRSVAGEFALLGPSRIGFRLGAYDAELPLVIDPTLVTSTFLGGIGSDSGYAIAVDPEGNTYVTGATESADFPTNAPLQQALNGIGPTSDVFVSKLSPDGTRLVWSTYLGGRGRDTGYGVAVATDGSVYVTGVTESPDFPVARAAQSGYGGGPSDAFVARIAANGTGIEWSTFIGGGGIDRGRGLAVDSTGNAYVTGTTGSADFRSVNPQQPGPFRADDLDAFLVKLPSAGSPFTFATRLGGGNDDRGLAVALDTQNNPYVTGDTLSPGFPTVKPIQATSGGSAGGVAGSFADAFVSKYNSNGSALIYSTFLGGSDVDQGTAIAVDTQGAAYVVGNTNSPNFPTAGALQATKGTDADAFVTKIDPAGGALVYSTYLGGTGADGANAVAVDRTGSAHIVGTTGSANLATAKPVQSVKSGGDDAFLVRLDSTGRGPLFASFLGGRESDAGMGVAIDTQGGAHVLGLSGSADFPSIKPVQGSRPAAGGDAFVASYNLIDAAAPAPATTAAAGAAAPGSSSSSSAHDRRVRILFGLTLAFLLVAVAQTLFLRRRTPAVATRTQARPAPSASRAAGGGGAGGGGTKAGASAKAPMPPRSSRSPKARGGPKGGGPRAGGPQKGGNRKTPARPKAMAGEPAPLPPPAPADDAGELTEAVGVLDDAGPPTVAAPPPPPPRVKPQEPAIAQLLEEDLWAPEPAPAGPDEPAPSTEEGAEAGAGDEPASAAAEAVPPPAPPAPEWAPFDTGSTPAVGATPGAEPAHPIPPVPAEELSFWDLFPEDLPPARPTAFPAEDLLVDPLALPEGPDSAAGRLAGEPAADEQPVAVPAPPAPERPSYTPETEIVIAELLDGPLPTGVRQQADAVWAPPAPGDDFRVDDLLIDRPAPDADEEDDGEDDDLAGATQGRSPEEQARVAADRARRRRSRRGGRRRPPGDG